MRESLGHGRRRRSLIPVIVLATIVFIFATGCIPAEETGPMSARLQKFSYGPSPQQFGFLSTPREATGRDEPLPVIVLVHGGFWSNRVGVETMAPLADDLVDRGYAVWNLEYRRLGDDGGGFPETLEDVAAGMDHLAVLAGGTEADLDLDRVTAIGHSAGGHLALWSAGRGSRAGTKVTVEVTLGLAAVSDLAAAVDNGVGANSIVELIGGTPDEEPDRYAAAQPAVPETGSVILIHGEDDRVVPVGQSLESATRLRAQLVLLPEADHFDLIDPEHPAWHEIVSMLGP